MGDQPQMEHWINTGRGLIVLSCMNADGSIREEPVRGRAMAIIKPEDRRKHSAECMPKQNPFLTGLLQPANEAAVAGLAEQQGGHDGFGAFSNLPVAAAGTPAPQEPLPAEQPGVIEVGAPLSQEEILAQLADLQATAAALQAQLAGAPSAPAPAAPAAAPAPGLDDEPVGNVAPVADPRADSGSGDPGYQVLDGDQVATVPPAPRRDRPATPAPALGVPNGLLTEDQMRRIAESAPGEEARALLAAATSTVQVEQVRALAKQLEAPQRRVQLIEARLAELDPHFQPTGRGPRTVKRGADEAGPQSNGFPADEPVGIPIVGPGQEEPHNVRIPGEDYDDDAPLQTLVKESAEAGDAPPPQPLPASMSEFADIDNLVT